MCVGQIQGESLFIEHQHFCLPFSVLFTTGPQPDHEYNGCIYVHKFIYALILYIIHVLYIWYILCTQKWGGKKTPSSGWQNQHFNYTLCSITLQETPCTYIQF